MSHFASVAGGNVAGAAIPSQQRTPESASFDEEKKAHHDVPAFAGGHGVSHILTEGRNNYVSSEDAKRTSRIMRALDLRVLPIASLLYLFSFLDRSAIGNARVAGMYVDLKLTYPEYAGAVSAFFGLYALLEIPSNLMLKKYGAKLWLPFIVVVWGMIMTFTGLVRNFEGLLAMRILLGGAEAGLFPGVTYWLTTLYPRQFIQLRIGIFFSAATVAGAFGGLLAYGLSKVSTGDYNGWSWIFFVEGLLTVVVGVASYWVLFSNLDTAKFLTEDDRDFMKNRVQLDATDVPMDDSFQWTYVWAGLLDWKPWFNIVFYVCTITPLYSIALTLPTILKTSLGYDAIHSQLMTVPIYVVAAVMVIIFAFVSDRVHNRSLPLIIGCAVSAIGWGVGYHYPLNGKVRYGAMFLSSFSYAAFPSVVALLTQNAGGKTKRSVQIALVVGIGGLAGTISSNIFPTKWAPQFLPSYKMNIIFNCVAILFAGLNWVCLYLANQAKIRKIESGEAAQLSHDELARMGDNSPYFVYKY